MRKPTLFGAGYSVYVRAARLTLFEKGVDYELVPVDVFATGGPPATYLERQPFGRIPAFEHGGFALYETGAITRYVEEAFEGPALQPGDPRTRARMNQIISIADGYLYATLVWGIYVEQVSKPLSGRQTEIAKLQPALDRAPTCLRALSDLMVNGPWLCGSALSLADLHVAPMIDYFLKAPVASDMMAENPAVFAWWERMANRPSMRATDPTS
ncbi:glutathione S-transferase [Rhizobium petrolearium]|uniref:glutathione S-transferase family protein n=1 Tax=Neorhizobium petrolearium TaxID=515361 RepID=UPI001AE39B11|nr:glutathione S-transferase family protein [Neorhizobium petrolearium]MBP1842323.1 glutathione S-transferase [Neorhizobium petrolearium]